MNKISVVGAGAFGTALANTFVLSGYETILYGRDSKVVNDIDSNCINSKYLPGVLLSKHLNASNDTLELENSNWIFLAVPSSEIINCMEMFPKIRLCNDVVFVNLAKGFSWDDELLIKSLRDRFSYEFAILKGPTFANELAHGQFSSLTFASKKEKIIRKAENELVLKNISIDYTTDEIGVEYLSILKNVYAISMGIIDSFHNSANTRFLFFTKVVNEMRGILSILGGEKDTFFKYCGIGDLGLTALNDLSRNRIIGLSIGKGFLLNWGTIPEDSSIVVEGVRSARILLEIINNNSKRNLIKTTIIENLCDYFVRKIDFRKFVINVLEIN